MCMLINDGYEHQQRLGEPTTCASAGCVSVGVNVSVSVSVGVGVRVNVGFVGASANFGHVGFLKPAGTCSRGR